MPQRVIACRPTSPAASALEVAVSVQVARVLCGRAPSRRFCLSTGKPAFARDFVRISSHPSFARSSLCSCYAPHVLPPRLHPPACLLPFRLRLHARLLYPRSRVLFCAPITSRSCSPELPLPPLCVHPHTRCIVVSFACGFVLLSTGNGVLTTCARCVETPWLSLEWMAKCYS